MDLSASNNTRDNLSCLNFTVKTFNIVFDTKMTLSSCAVVANFVAIAFVFIAKRYTDFLYRLLVYLMITDVLQALASIFSSLPVHVRHDGVVQVKSEDGCLASGYFSMATMWMGNIIFFWISLHLAYRGWCLYRHVDARRDDSLESVTELKDIRDSRKYPIKEIVGVLTLFIAPFAIASIPFAIEPHHGTSYGLSGLGCWIKPFSSPCHHDKTLIIYLLLFFYGPLMIIVMLAVIFIVIAFCCYCHGEVRKNDKDKKKKKHYIKEIMILLPLPLVYWTPCMFLLINHIYTTIHENGTKPPFVPLWIVHATADSLRSMLPALAFLLHPFVWQDRAICLCKKSDHKSETSVTGIISSRESPAPPSGYQNYGSLSNTHAVFDTNNNN